MKFKIFSGFIFFSLLILFCCCGPNQKNELNIPQENESSSEITSDQFFWGKWIRMDNGKSYEILESYITGNGYTYSITASDSNSLTATNLGTFNKESESVIVCDNIPYFRDGGVNLEYTLKLVGMSSEVDRAASSGFSGIKGRGKSKKYTGFQSNAESDSEGNLTFIAPTADDVQTVTISSDNNTLVIPDLVVVNSGDYMGTVALTGKTDYNLKITGVISEAQKMDGYIFGNNAKSYDIDISITNISENKCSSSVCSIEPADSKLSVSSTDDTELSGFGISTLEKGAVKTVHLSVEYGELSEPYIDTGLKVKIQNPFTGQEWTDFVPLRFYKGTIPITIAAKNPEDNKDAALNGFIIFPDGNSQFFAIPHNKTKILFVPTFGNDKKYMLVFSGATVSSQLSDSTEMFYTVELGKTTPRKVETNAKTIELDELLEYMIFGGDNHKETSAYDVTQSFEAYLQEGEIDYYTITADSDSYYNLSGKAIYTVEYETERGYAPSAFSVVENTVLSAEKLPEWSVIDDYLFLGWYDGETQIEANKYAVNKNLHLVAKWTNDYVTVSFHLSSGLVSKSLFLPRDSALTESQLSEIDNTYHYGQTFAGWYVLNSSDEVEIVVSGYVPDEDIYLSPIWVDNIENYTVVPGKKINPYYICKSEVTQAEYVSVMNSNPSGFTSNPDEEETQTNRPVENVNWYDAIYFCNKYSMAQGLTPCYKVNGNTDITEWNYVPHSSNIIEGTIECDFEANGYRLPTEEEWYQVGQSNYLIAKIPEDKSPLLSGWFLENSNNKTHEVKLQASNWLGVYDMAGNVSEWCWNLNDGSTNAADAGKRAVRGGAWNCAKADCVSSIQNYTDPVIANNTIGFRLVRSVKVILQ